MHDCIHVWGEQKELVLDKTTGRVAFPAALPGQRLGPGTVHSQIKLVPGNIRTASMVALKKNTEVGIASSGRCAQRCDHRSWYVCLYGHASVHMHV